MATMLDDQIGRVLGGRYRLLAPIGSGTSAQAFLADDATLRRRVAVKVLHPTLARDDTFLRRFRLEAQAAAALNHPHVMAVYDWGQEDLPYLVGEYLGGGSLRSMLDAGHRLSRSQALLVGLEAARGLDYAHRRGIVHRDVKPANLLFDDEGRLRIADFGLARALAEAGWTEPQGTVVGTVRYASPEQARGEPLTGRSDVYALALVLIEAVTGEVPFAADTAIGTLMARVDQQLPVPAAMGPLRRALERAGRPDPEDRPDAGELVIALMAAAEELERPAPFPLVGALRTAPGTLDERNRTLHAPSPGGRAPARRGEPPGGDPPPAPPAPSAPQIADAPSPAPPRPEPAAAAPTGTVDLDRDEDDPPRRRWPWVLLGLLLVLGAAGAGAAAYVANRTLTHEVPDLVGASAAELEAVAEENDWVLERHQDRSDEVGTGEVIRTDPATGEQLAEGEVLSATISVGPTFVAIPDVLGEELAVARERLEEAGLALEEPVSVEFHEEIPENHVIRVATPLSELPRGESVELVVSQGPAPREVPAGLQGQPLDEVQTAIEELGLVVVTAEEYSDSVAAGSVVSLEPGPGELVPRGGEVQVVVSQGPAPREVPDVEEMSVGQATEELRGQGFEIDGVDGDPSREVLTTDPPAGEVHPYGTPVRIIARRN